MSLGVQCRFTPSCSEYAIESLETHGVARGIFLTAHRLGRCHPFCVGGTDPVPRNFVASSERSHGKRFG
ncbi:MAG: membrane protein insertion efficiency factor YidD [Bdellovibrionota bacterium]